MDPVGIALILFISALLSGGITLYTWRLRGTPGTGIVFCLMLGTTIAVFAYGMELLSATLSGKLAWVRIRYVGTALIYPTYLLLALWHTNRQKWLAAGRIALLFFLPAFSVLGMLTNSLHHLHYTSVSLNTDGPFPMIVKTLGPLYGFYVITSLGYILLALVILGLNYYATSPLFRRQTAALMIGTAVPLAAALLYFAGLRPLGGLNLLPFAYTISSLTAAWIILSQRLFNLRPVARGMVFENMTDGFIVLNKELQVVDANPSTLRVLGLSPDCVGRFGNRAFVNHPSLIRLIHSEPHAHVQIQQDGRIFDAFRTSLIDQQQSLTGHLISLRDITSIKQAEEALRQSELRFRQISHLTTDIIYSCTNGREGIYAIDWMSGNTAAVTGYTIEEIKARPCWRFLVIEEDLPLFEENVTGLDPGQLRTVDLRLRHKDGRTIWVTSHAECVREANEPEPTLRLYGGLVDITSHRQLVENLRKSESQYRFLTENMNDILWMMDLNLRTVYVTPSIKTVLGFTQEERVRQEIQEQLTPQSLRIAQERLTREKVLERQGSDPGRKATLTLEFYHRDGSTRWLETIISGIRDDQGTLTGVYGVSRDVTERKKAEEAIRESEARIKSISNNLPFSMIYQLVMKSDGTRKFTYFSDSVRELHGLSPEEAMADPSRIYGLVHEDDIRQLLQKEKEALQTLSTFKMEIRSKAPSGEVRWLSLASTPTLMEDGSVRWDGIETVIDERKEAEGRILQYSEELRERNKELHSLYSVSELVRKEETTQEDILSAGVSLIAQAYCYPQITGCRILWEGREYKTENFARTPWMQTSPLRVRGNPIGNIEVCYLEPRPEKDEGPFLNEERKFLDGIAELLGKSYERRLAVGEREKLIVELQNALHEVKTLTGLLPICASCKKIRNDQGYWERIERYFSERSSVQFSHGICPECKKKLYPEMDNPS